jgi:hypothetical protein
MPREIPGFLKDFMEMRRNLHKQTETPQIVSAVAANGVPKKTRASKGTADATREDLQAISVATIIEEKPPKKDVMDYFKRECDRLTAEKMK